MRAIQGISPHSKPAKGWWAHFDTGKASQGWGSPWRQWLADRPMKNISACRQGQEWKSFIQVSPTYVSSQRMDLSCEGEGAFILLILVILFLADLTLPITITLKERFVSCSALNLVSCGLLLARTSTRCPERMKRALLFYVTGWSDFSLHFVQLLSSGGPGPVRTKFPILSEPNPGRGVFPARKGWAG